MTHLSSVRRPHEGFFRADVLDAKPRDDIASMEHPLFALRAGDCRVHEYHHRGTTVTISPGQYGCATIHDKDLWIYCISQLNAAIDRGRDDLGLTVRIVSYDFLRATCRGTSGRSYLRMMDALHRLTGTLVTTSIKTGGKRDEAKFRLVESWRMIQCENLGRTTAVEVTLPRWLYRSVHAREVLSIPREYFRLTSSLDRRIYQICRKHCGHQLKWQIKFSVLHRKSGSRAPIRNFRQAVGSLAESNKLPHYCLRYDTSSDKLFVYARSYRGAFEQIKDAVEAGGKNYGDLFGGV